ncbi:MAG: SDR family NAD(P)-dependent oxidoreductase [Myxococcales bacterium]|nr:SDR family NAD(P)-dependent oxidoreductase [Myxococcales bacterium]
MAKDSSGTSVVVVGVGASRGTGAAIARRFAREGLHAFVAGRTLERLEIVAKEIREAGGQATPVVTDATREDDVIHLLDLAIEQGGPLDAVVYNAGRNEFRGLLDMDGAFFEEVWRLCCFTGFTVGREAARRMLERGSGSILFTGATASMRARPPFTAFASAKAALRAVAHGMAREFGPKGIHVGHVVIDGMIDGDMVNERFPAAKKNVGEEGMLDPEAIADAFFMIHAQPRRAWTLELDLRPHIEKF